MKIARIALLSISLLSIFTCHKMSPSVGKARDVVVVASHPDSNLIMDNIQLYRYVPQREPTFIFIFAPDTMLKALKQFHSLFLYGSLKDDFIYELLDVEARQATINDTFNLFKIDNLWAKNQTVVILVAADSVYIQAAFQKYNKMVIKILEDGYYQKVKSSFYEKDMDIKVKEVLHKFGWEMDVPVGWMIDSTYKNENFIFVHTHYPDRSIFLYKEKNASLLSDSFAIEKRNSLTRKYYNGDYILKELSQAEPIEFKNMKGIRITGVWQNDSLVAGGPFISYLLRKRDSLYIIDGILFLPGERKTDYLIGLEVMLNSFQIIE